VSDEWGADGLDLPAYLDRIRWSGRQEPTVEVLAALHRAHVAAIPFENLDVFVGRGISVALADVQDKLVARRRGGYCYEHSTVFGAALERFGFEVQRVLARVGDPGDGRRPRTHLALIVTLGPSRWLADVGFGSGLLEPAPLDGTPRRQGGWTHRVIGTPSAWALEELGPDGWTSSHRFAEEQVHPSDVLVSNHFSSTFPRSPFVRQLVAVRKDEQTLTSLRGHVLTTSYADGRVAEERVLPDDEVTAVLSSTFGLALTPADRVALSRAFAATRPVGSAVPVQPQREGF
jgi:N-hydroxyarylamine O-acetyltransferase